MSSQGGGHPLPLSMLIVQLVASRLKPAKSGNRLINNLNMTHDMMFRRPQGIVKCEEINNDYVKTSCNVFIFNFTLLNSFKVVILR